MTAAALLATGGLRVVGRLRQASNATLYCVLEPPDGQAVNPEVGCVYKPRAGERPLWDFPDGTLANREVAVYEVSRAAGWDLVPLTMLRDGPFGPGMCQLWIEQAHGGMVDVVPVGHVAPGWCWVLDAEDADGAPVSLVHADRPDLRRLALLDIVVNNADRKGGHVLADASGRLQGIDHGVCFNVDDKLRTVLWGWAGQRLLPDELSELRHLDELLAGSLGRRLGELVAPAEVDATCARLRRLLRDATFPRPGGEWPTIPWPAF